LLENLREFLGVGRIYINKYSVHLRVESLSEINKLIEILGNNPFLSEKGADYLLFKQAVEEMNKRGHLTSEGLEKIVAIRASMN
jgi:DNA polymerase/3'-5' exonuclease PolX